MSQYLQYLSDLEKPAADESETIQKIIDVMLKGQHNGPRLRKTRGTQSYPVAADLSPKLRSATNGILTPR